MPGRQRPTTGARHQAIGHILGIIAGTAANLVFVPDGDSSVGTANPSYTGSAFLTSYSLSADVGSVVQYSAAYQGTGANTRAEA